MVRTEFSKPAASHSVPTAASSKQASRTRWSSSASMTSVSEESARRKGSRAGVAESFWCAATMAA